MNVDTAAVIFSTHPQPLTITFSITVRVDCILLGCIYDKMYFYLYDNRKIFTDKEYDKAHTNNIK